MMFDVDVFQKSFITYGANKWNKLDIRIRNFVFCCILLMTLGSYNTHQIDLSCFLFCLDPFRRQTVG